MQTPLLLSITPAYVAILGLLFIVFTMRAGMYRAKTKIFIGIDDDPEMLRRVRGQANFIETVPMALFLIILMELLGAADIWLHALCGALVLGRICHYLGLTQMGPAFLRVIGMMATLISILVSSVWILITTI